MLTGSKSKGKRQYYYYYHCGCGVRFNALEANKIFEKQLALFCPRIDAIELYIAIITQVYRDRTQGGVNFKKEILQDIEKYTEKVTKARTLLLNDDIEAADFKAIKSECE